jgi:WD40 repeat protein
MQGKVRFFDAATQRVETLTAFLEEGVRGLYMDDTTCYVTAGDECRCWRRSEPFKEAGHISFRSLDRKMAQNVKFVLQTGPLACCLFTQNSAVVHVGKREHHHRAFRLLDHGQWEDVAPCDFDGEQVALLDRSHTIQQGGDSMIRIRVMHLETNQLTEVDKLLGASQMSILKLWNSNYIAYVVGNTLHIYDFRNKRTHSSLGGAGREILAVDTRSAQSIVTLNGSGEVKLWNTATGECSRTLRIPEAGFFFGFPYFVSAQGGNIAVSADEGVYLIELEAGASDI